MNRTVHLLITGGVTGVFYRASAKDMAKRYGITGWIKNTDDDDVEAMVSGNEISVDEFIEWCKAGPANAKVEQVIVYEKGFIKFNTFEIIK